MTQTVRLLHITDTHLNPAGSPFARDDDKVKGLVDRQTREDAIDSALKRMAERLTRQQQKLEGVVFCGDAWSAGVSGGEEFLLKSILQHLGALGVTPQRIVAVPGNHDVPKGANPSSKERYEKFIQTWRGAGCITPWLDGIDRQNSDPALHMLLGRDNAWAVVAVNSSNWCHVNAIPEELKEIWGSIPATLAPNDDKRAKRLADVFTKLAQYDLAKVSEEQLEFLRNMLQTLAPPKQGRQLRMLALHHHLRSPNLSEELKPFADMSNIEQMRTFIAQQDFRIVLHGHKHVSRVHADYIEQTAEQAPHKVLLVAGSSFTPTEHADAMRVLEVDGLPWAPSLEVVPQVIPRGGIEVSSPPTVKRRIWDPLDDPETSPVVIQGSDFDEVYAKVVIAAQNEALEKTLIVQLDLAEFAAVNRLPSTYPTLLDCVADRERWLKGLVDWWQLPQSQLHMRVPYLHGTRLHRYGNNLDQISRVRELLTKGQTTRAIALLVDPAIDFKEDSSSTTKADFASFCLVQFTRRKNDDGTDCIDCVGYYRAQEMVKWWPINVAELHHLQLEIGRPFGAKAGRITTITACARAQARSPTHVAMPAIDRWLDQSPEKYFVLATSLLSTAPMDESASKVLDEWIAGLDDLVLTATAPTPDGGPVVAIEGPRRLAAYLDSGSQNRSDARGIRCRQLAIALKEVARLGWTGAPSDRVEMRSAWGTTLAELLRKVAVECRALREESRNNDVVK